eukprot:EG_transcript_11960
MDDFWQACCFMSMAFILVNAVMLSLLSLQPQTVWSPNAFPSPQTDLQKCGRNQTGWVCDPDRILTMYEHVHLEGLIDSISTECVHQCGDAESGYRVAVAIMRRISHPDWSTTDVGAFVTAFADTIAARWGLNASACDDAVLLLVITDYNLVHLTVGSGARPVLTEEVSDIISDWAKNDLDTGVADAIAGALMLIRDAFLGKDIQPAPDPSPWVIFLLMMGFICGLPLIVRLMDLCVHLLVWLLSPLVNCLVTCWLTVMAVPRAIRKTREHLRRIQQEVEGMHRGGSYQQKMCPICLEDFPESTAEPADATPLMASSIQRLNCYHRFHAACIREWMESSNTFTCPLCREAIDLDDLDGPPESERTYKAWLRYYLSRLYARHPQPERPSQPAIDNQVDHLFNNRGTDWATANLPEAGDVPWARSISIATRSVLSEAIARSHEGGSPRSWFERALSRGSHSV